MKFSMLLLSLVFSLSTQAQVVFRGGQPQQPIRSQVETTAAPTDDKNLVQALASHRNVYFLEAAHLTVTGLLPDDQQGLPHQKFMVKTSTGGKVLCVYNLDKGQRIPLKVGDDVGLGGEFKWTNQGGLMHWLHQDDSNRRPDGYVELAGRRYGLN